jgi:hypothetical protein
MGDFWETRGGLFGQRGDYVWETLTGVEAHEWTISALLRGASTNSTQVATRAGMVYSQYCTSRIVRLWVQ